MNVERMKADFPWDARGAMCVSGLGIGLWVVAQIFWTGMVGGVCGWLGIWAFIGSMLAGMFGILMTLVVCLWPAERGTGRMWGAVAMAAGFCSLGLLQWVCSWVAAVREYW